MTISSGGGAFRLFRLMIGLGVAIVASMLMVTVSADDAKAETVLSSWYGPGFAGNITANGEIYDPYGYTAAHKTLPLGTELVVNYNGRSVNVVVNDRGPYIAGRELDLSQGAAEYLGLDRAGVDYVDYYTVGQGYVEPQSVATSQTTADDSGAVYDSGSNAGYSSQTYVDQTQADGSGGYSETNTTVSNTNVSNDTSVSQGGYADGGGGGAHLIQSGDTLSGIAASSGVSVDYLASVNGIQDIDHIVSGQTLYL